MRSPAETDSSSTSSSSSAGSQQRSDTFQAVWKLHCKHCGVLWSSRGMEAVVMARPAIRCFSTDLPPLGCDIVYQPVAPALLDMVSDSGCHTCSSLSFHARRFDLAPAGPCDCHVQDIGCLGCGNVVGYYIHRPCFRCLAQRLRIKQRGFQHLWTFYQDNVTAVQREDEDGEPVGWEELPSPPPPAASAARPRVIETANTNSRSLGEALVDAQRSLPSTERRVSQRRTLGRDPPLRPSTQTVSQTTTQRRDEALEPLCPYTKQKPSAVVPAGLCNWLFQVGLDCMVKWEQVSLSR
ncbi:hypothetical protein GGF46_002122 [Coemansia sp. RSA 552]|nr:hypothetical protein GGF46_002122 [Coemansia sp. RSA 552]